MKRTMLSMAAVALMLVSVTAKADKFTDTIELFKNSGESAGFFKTAYGYAVFPTVGKGGLVVGAAYGEGKVFVGGNPVGTTSVTQLSVGFQAGGQAYSMIVFFQDQRAFKEFTKGNFEAGAGVGAVAITAAAGASATTAGSQAGASGGKKNATTAGSYNKGMAFFTIAKGGAMYEATIQGMKFDFKPL